MTQPAVYIMASQKLGTLYVGVTSNVRQRVNQHKSGAYDGFTRQYRVYRLVHLELFATMKEAIAREKRLKEWKRAWKIQLVEETNPDWRDLTDQL
jgi:putative endonuclease